MASKSNSQLNEEENKCCYRHCTQDSKLINHDTSRVDVKAYEPKKKKPDWCVDWAGDGSATFHRDCWQHLVAATGMTRSSGIVSLSDVERSMVLEAKKTAEFHDGESAIRAEAARIADMLKSCKYCIAFTGAGISTAAGIGDFRGKDGKWTERDKAKNFGKKKTAPGLGRGTAMNQLRPTYTHEALCKLMEVGVIKFIISQNVDSLHRLSGIPSEKLSELHGNSFEEKCEDCGAKYQLKHNWRQHQPSSFPPKMCSRCKISHRTGRKCTQQGCKGFLMNTIINFGDYLESDVLGTARHHAKMADCVLVLGSSLKVSPANDLVTMGKAPIRLIMCNRQVTPYDDECSGPDSPGSRIYGNCDTLMSAILERVLSPQQLTEWDAEKETRSLNYNLQRTI